MSFVRPRGKAGCGKSRLFSETCYTHAVCAGPSEWQLHLQWGAAKRLTRERDLSQPHTSPSSTLHPPACPELLDSPLLFPFTRSLA